MSSTADFKIKQYSVSVSGFTDQQFFAASPGKARVKAWESYRRAYDTCTFKDFMRKARVRRCDWPPLPKRFGEKILVGGEEAYWVKTDGHYVWFVRPGQEQIRLSHPLDVKELTC